LTCAAFETGYIGLAAALSGLFVTSWAEGAVWITFAKACAAQC